MLEVIIHCDTCKRNCHSPCHCSNNFGCKIFTLSGYCKECGHHKSSHDIHSTYKYVDETERDKIDNSEKIQKERDRFLEKYKEIINENYRKKNLKENKEREKNSLIKKKNQYLSKKYNFNKDKDILNSNIKKIYNEISLIIIEVIHLKDKIYNNCLNKKHFEIEIEYINTLLFQIENIGENNQINELKQIKRYNEIYLYLKDISEFELKAKGAKYFLDKIENLFY